MKVAILSDVYKIDIKEIEKPKIKNNEVLIRVKATGVCGSDLHAYRGHHPFRKPPVILGHEVSGTVEEIGNVVNNIKIGDRVTVEPQVGCGECEYCLVGKYNLCINRRAPGVGNWNGTFAEYFVAPERTVYKLPDKISFDEGALIEPLAVGVHAIRNADIKLGNTVAILGAGTIGLMSLIAAKNAGASRIYVSDLLDYNLSKAKELGADVIINTENDNIFEIVKKEDSNGVDEVIITAAFPIVWEEALKISKKGGGICIVGMFDKPVTTDLLQLLMSEKSVYTSWVYRREDFEISIKIAQEVNLNSLITHKFSLEDTAKALKIMDDRKENMVKVILNN